jgi:predicted Zn-dependent protease
MASIYNYFLPVNPVTDRREFHFIPSFVEQFVGSSSYAPLIKKSGGVIVETDRSYGRHVQMVKEIGRELAALAKRKDIKFEFVVINSIKDNAWCLPGGKIGINIGLIRNMEKDDSTNFNLREKIAAVLSRQLPLPKGRGLEGN